MVDKVFFEKLLRERDQYLHALIEELAAAQNHPRQSQIEDMAEAKEGDEVLHGREMAAREELAEVHKALGRLEEGSYGLCLECGEAISPERLEAVPYTSLCKQCATGQQN